ncbi:nitrous oxide-stimulated promoter family protein [Aliarcobacter cibarius]|jgi:hypothetical protein|uniref:Putative nitrous oxide-regulated protein n=1 Tax=Aliarcobacter cibarius TaxID=255507 RepID=A0A5J6REP0_9BACT|nr:nitrous oxide-stimulated promoter family protein [Aliarcobacter cibarius]QEZ88244.1 putative nitrous oxide-regulated protein [Aliarcobacter cibarius]QKJ26040.1 putative nitrous oxide-regulated protein [Aliarcobacter cibarius]TLT00217.1 hypothetical protein FE247_04565 [Aliarcobacter cibarius]TLT00604.1 hypothetical protein FE245_04845 [Aliarcobacter cibarius]TLT05123.1 hypothetical protein FE248_00080 [Aliarcobacter cibarius]
MTNDKFEIEINTLKKFYELYCRDKHTNQESKLELLNYKNQKYFLLLSLCTECYKAISYSFNKLKDCPHDIKPRCRACPTPCYEKEKWKEIAKVMKYSAIKLSLGKIKSRVMNLFN